MPTTEERLTALETKVKVLCEDLRGESKDLWEAVNGIRNTKCVFQKKECDDRMDKAVETLQKSIQESWNRMITVLKIFVPACMILFTILFGWAFIQQSRIAGTEVAISKIETQMQYQNDIQKETLRVLKNLDAKLK